MNRRRLIDRLLPVPARGPPGGWTMSTDRSPSLRRLVRCRCRRADDDDDGEEVNRTAVELLVPFSPRPNNPSPPRRVGGSTSLRSSRREMAGRGGAAPSWSWSVAVGSVLLFFLLPLVRSATPSCHTFSSSLSNCAQEGVTHPEQCGDSFFRCNDRRMEIRFGGGGWYPVVHELPAAAAKFVLVEDPALSPVFTTTQCDFLYTFLSPGPPFVHVPPGDFAAAELTNSYCEYISGDGFRRLATKLIKGDCAGYTLSCSPSKASPGMEPRAPACSRDSPPSKLIWNLSLTAAADGGSGYAHIRVVWVGFSARHALAPGCFSSSPEQAFYSCAATASASPGRAAKHTARGLVMGFAAAAAVVAVSGGLFCLWRRSRRSTRTSPSSTLLSRSSYLGSLREKGPEDGAGGAYPTHVFRYEELHEATDGFGHAHELDSGGFGVVYRGKLRDGRAVAVKRLYQSSCRRADLFWNEVAILSRLRHPNLVVLYGCTSRHSRELILVYEFVPNGTVADHLHGRRAAEGALTWALRLRIAAETAGALAYMHAAEPPIIHRDVKTSNILLDGDFRVKVADFGLSRLFPASASHVSTVPQGTPGYVDPEYHRCFQLSDKSDVYSFGVVLAELISSKPAVDLGRGRHEINLSSMALDKIQKAAVAELVDPSLGFDTDWKVRRSVEQMAELVLRCLQGERDMRPTMDEVLEDLREMQRSLQQAETAPDGEEADRAASHEMALPKNHPPESPNGTDVPGTEDVLPTRNQQQKEEDL